MPSHVIYEELWASKKLARCSLRAALAYPWIYLHAAGCPFGDGDQGRLAFL